LALAAMTTPRPLARVALPAEPARAEQQAQQALLALLALPARAVEVVRAAVEPAASRVLQAQQERQVLREQQELQAPVVRVALLRTPAPTQPTRRVTPPRRRTRAARSLA
jgi:hypothetical protein